MTSPVQLDDNSSRIPEAGQLLALGVCLAGLSAVASLLNVSSWHIGGVTILWPANGFLLGFLLCSSRRQWPAYLALAYAVDFVVNLALGSSLFIACFFSASNVFEVIVAAVFLYPIVSPDPDFTRSRQLLYLLLYGVILAPALTSLMVMSYIRGYYAPPTFRAFQFWFTADALGMAIFTPLYLSFSRRSQFAGRSWPEIATHFLVLTVITTLVFGQTRYPLLFLILPSLIFLGMRLRLAGSGVGLLLVSVIGGVFTSHGRGPIFLSNLTTNPGRALLLQFFIAVSLFMLYTVEVILSRSDRLQLDLQASENRFRILAEASRDVIVLTDLEGARRYVSPAVYELLGWSPAELLGNSYRQIVHPGDIEQLESLLRDCRDGKPCGSLSYRCRRRDGTYLWMEANVRLYSDSVTGLPVGFVNVVRDIHARKAAEDQLHEAFHLVENLASIDGLTGLANRRRFDEVMDVEWRRAMRDRTALSLLILDVDHFKRYNDLYGHLQGDASLRQVADCARTIVHRSSDLLARYGGEEFIVILPNTDSAGALLLAEQIRHSIEQLDLPHTGNPHRRVTISIGCATHSPLLETTPDILFAAADQALYRAKAAGRNCIVSAEEVLLA